MAVGRTRGPWRAASLTVDGASALAAVTATTVAATGAVSTSDSTAKLAERWFPWQHFVFAQTTGAATTLVGGVASEFISSAELNSAGVGGLLVAAAGDQMTVLFKVPYDMDVTASVAFEVPMHFASASQTGDSITLNLYWKAFTNATTALAVPATAAGTQFSARAWAVDDAIHVATGAVIAANLWTIGLYVGVLIEATTLTSFSANEVSVLGLNMIYTKRHL